MLKTIGGVIVIVLATAGTIVIGIAVLPQLFGLSQAQGFTQISAFRGLIVTAAAVATILCVVAALVRRGSRRVLPAILAVVLAGVSVTGAVVIAGRGIDDRPTAGESTDLPGQVTVLTWNTLRDGLEPGTIAAVAIREGADVVSLPETSAATARTAAAAMTAAGRPMVAHTGGTGVSATSLLVSTGLGEYAVRETGAGGALDGSETVVAEPVLGDGPTIVAVHTTAPLPSRLGDWRAQLAELAAICGPGADVILAGDFNATLDHLSPLRGAGDLGSCHDAGANSAVAGLGTWPVQLPPVLGAPIDHVMAGSGWVTIAARVLTEFDDSGSDHRPVVATLLPRTAP
ncbi:endonuclease/exonuclease/phosphatase family protein [Plantibacter flavus]|uniref:endonuclease/exonuclease/phosphatase family protein n=1 Tax=Plantibacter flavus TaxID=150123 RepID=UPI003F187F40